MNKKEVAEIKRRFKQGATTITRLCGCYVNAEKEKVLTFHKNFLNLPDEEFYKYLEIAKKTLSGTNGNNLVELEFPASEEEKGGKQFSLMALRDGALKSEPEVEAFFDMVIDTYDYAGNYLILLFHDCYDIPMKASDHTKIGESDEVYNYILCSICPVNLSKPALGYKQAENDIGARERDWVVSAPESGFIFPCFTDRSTDIHSVLTYTKNTKEPHKELWEDILGCGTDTLTSDEKKEIFFNIVKHSFPDNEDSRENDVKKCIIEHQELLESEGKDVNEPVTEELVKEIFEEAGEEKAEKLAKECEAALKDQMPKLDELVKSNETKKIEETAEKIRLVKENEKLKAMLPEEVKSAEIIVSVPKEKETGVIFSDDKSYVMIPVENMDVILVNGKVR